MNLSYLSFGSETFRNIKKLKRFPTPTPPAQLCILPTRQNFPYREPSVQKTPKPSEKILRSPVSVPPFKTLVVTPLPRNKRIRKPTTMTDFGSIDSKSSSLRILVPNTPVSRKRPRIPHRSTDKSIYVSNIDSNPSEDDEEDLQDGKFIFQRWGNPINFMSEKKRKKQIKKTSLSKSGLYTRKKRVFKKRNIQNSRSKSPGRSIKSERGRSNSRSPIRRKSSKSRSRSRSRSNSRTRNRSRSNSRSRSRSRSNSRTRMINKSSSRRRSNNSRKRKYTNRSKSRDKNIPKKSRLKSRSRSREKNDRKKRSTSRDGIIYSKRKSRSKSPNVRINARRKSKSKSPAIKFRRGRKKRSISRERSKSPFSRSKKEMRVKSPWRNNFIDKKKKITRRSKSTYQIRNLASKKKKKKRNFNRMSVRMSGNNNTSNRKRIAKKKKGNGSGGLEIKKWRKYY